MSTIGIFERDTDRVCSICSTRRPASEIPDEREERADEEAARIKRETERTQRYLREMRGEPA